MKTGHVTIEAVIKQAKEALMCGGIKDDTYWSKSFEDAIEQYEMSIVNPEMRERVCRDLIGEEIWCWTVLPEFAKFEDEGYETVTVEFPAGDGQKAGESITVPLCY